jgi:lambda family phage portal protein
MTNQQLKGSLNYRKVPYFHQTLGLRNIIHSYIELRPGQTRGLPFISSVIAKLRKLEKYSDAELGAAVITSFFAIAFKKQAAGAKPALSFSDLMGKDKTSTNPVTKERQIHLSPEQQLDLEPGEDIEIIKSDRPNSGYSAFVDAIFREVSISLNIPKEILVKEFGRSYSASRGAIGEAFKYFLELRNNFAAEFCQPVYERWLFEEVAEGRINAPGFLEDSIIRRLWCTARWIGPAKGMLDENKEASAAEKRINIGISTRKKEAINYDGSRIEDVYAQRQHEAELEKGIEEGETDV